MKVFEYLLNNGSHLPFSQNFNSVMGIPGLWEILKPTAHSRTLTQLTVCEGFEANRRGTGTVKIGLDGSLALNRAQWAAYHQSRHRLNMQAGENLPLQILFYQICRLMMLPVNLIVVFDGPDRPRIKRGTKVRSAPHALQNAYIQLLTATGFSAHIAPGEADAELGALNLQGHIDAVMTDDVDIFLFGANTIIRLPNVVANGDQISLYTAAAISSHRSTNLTRPRIFLIAILSGGDYDNGLNGCGIKIAHKISTCTTLGDELYTAVISLHRQDLKAFLRGWRDRLKSVLAGPNSILGRQYTVLAQSVTSQFPCIEVLYAYLRPPTSCSDVPENHDPDLSSLAIWCEKYFSWASSQKLLDRFRSKVWSGICIREFLKPLDANAAIANHVLVNLSVAGRPHILRINKATLGEGNPSRRPNIWGYTIEVEEQAFVQAALSKLAPEHQKHFSKYIRKKFNMWIPRSILERALPSLVARFHQTNPMSVQPPLLPLLTPLSACAGTQHNPILVECDSEAEMETDKDDSEEVAETSVHGPPTRIQFLLDFLDHLL
ncbi:hypothetical protein H0H93_002807 [Arthromyces matolae]|nr:hypothetical protein H0H93_002807 [Arthromyces matolae]